MSSDFAEIPPIEGLTGAEELRLVVAYLNGSNESAIDPYTPAQLVQLWRAYRLSGWEKLLHEWTEAQREGAVLCGHVPRWREGDETPIAGLHWSDPSLLDRRCGR